MARTKEQILTEINSCEQEIAKCEENAKKYHSMQRKLVNDTPDIAKAWVGSEFSDKADQEEKEGKRLQRKLKELNKELSIVNRMPGEVTTKPCAVKIEERNRLEAITRDETYNQLLEEKRSALNEQDFRDLAQKFGAMNDYKDATILSDECIKKLQEMIEEREHQTYIRLLEEKRQIEADEITYSNIVRFHKLTEDFKKMNGYKDANEVYKDCLNEANFRQSKLWISEGKCQYCGRKLSIFKKCKFCSQKK